MSFARVFVIATQKVCEHNYVCNRYCAQESLTGVPSNLVSVESTMMLHAGRQLGEEDSPRTCRPLAGSFVQCVTVCHP